MSKWGSPVEVEIRNRIRVALHAYAYEVLADPLVDDATFDKECLAIKPEMETGNAVMDKFFKEEFAPHTGQWIHKHPNLKGLEKFYLIATQARKEKDVAS